MLPKNGRTFYPGHIWGWGGIFVFPVLFLKTYVQLVALPWDYTVVACWPGCASQCSTNTEGWEQDMGNGAGGP